MYYPRASTGVNQADYDLKDVYKE